MPQRLYFLQDTLMNHNLCLRAYEGKWAIARKSSPQNLNQALLNLGMNLCVEN
ncbi:MAG: hypothetical protein MUF49_20025 [Oculatellaceae cyanobacterium Prado106]|nr:hypothetical protein [Oculatellaceae cyanobacterium Prado106]